MGTDQLVVFNNPFSKNIQHICLRIPNYDFDNSKPYMYPKNENGEKYLLKHDNLFDIDNDGYRNEKNEVLFYITKNI